jgi:hypothetical protein
VSDGHHQHHEPIVLDGGDDAVIADAVAPQPFAVAVQRMAETARVVLPEMRSRR